MDSIQMTCCRGSKHGVFTVRVRKTCPCPVTCRLFSRSASLHGRTRHLLEEYPVRMKGKKSRRGTKKNAQGSVLGTAGFRQPPPSCHHGRKKGLAYVILNVLYFLRSSRIVMFVLQLYSLLQVLRSNVDEAAMLN